VNNEDLLDLFAAFAMFTCIGNEGDYEADAKACYDAAEAMIKEKERRNERERSTQSD
jgi:hypothetical protein